MVHLGKTSSMAPLDVTFCRHVAADLSQSNPTEYSVHSIASDPSARNLYADSDSQCISPHRKDRTRRKLRLRVYLPRSLPHVHFRSKRRISKLHQPYSHHNHDSVYLRPPPSTVVASEEPNLEISVSRIASQKMAIAQKRKTDNYRILQLGYDDELERNFDFFSLFCVTFTAVGFLPGTFFDVFAAFDTGGTGMISFAWPLSGVFMCILAASLSELSSAWPVAGAMYSWTFVLCRASPRFRRLARFMSWTSGNIVLVGHLLAQMLLAYQFTTSVQGTLEIYTAYEISRINGILISCAILIICGIVVSTPLARKPWLWKSSAITLLASFLLTITSLLISTEKKQSFREVFSGYDNDTGFNSKLYVYMLGWCLTTLATGADAAAHLSEDAKRPSINVPRALFWSTLISYVLGWIAIIVMLMCTYDDELDQRRYFYAPTRILLANIPKPMACFIMVLLIINMAFQITSQIFSSSRFAWALARDSALPFSGIFRKVSGRYKLPRSATALVVSIAIPGMFLLSTNRTLISSMILQTCGFLTFVGYVMPIAIYACGERSVLGGDGRRAWSLRSFSMPAAWISVGFVATVLVIMSFPTSFPVTTVSFGWAPVFSLLVLVIICLTWVFYGNVHYAGPIKSVTAYTMGHEADLKSVQMEKYGGHKDWSSDFGNHKSAKIVVPTVNTRVESVDCDTYYYYSSEESATDDEWDTDDEDASYAREERMIGSQSRLSIPTESRMRAHSQSHV